MRAGLRFIAKKTRQRQKKHVNYARAINTNFPSAMLFSVGERYFPLQSRYRN